MVVPPCNWGPVYTAVAGVRDLVETAFASDLSLILALATTPWVT